MASFKPYDLNCEPSPSVPCETLIQDGWDTFLLFEPFSSDGEFVIVECEDCSSSRFGYPNDEGLPEHPHYKDGISSSHASVYISGDSPWLLDVTKQMRKSKSGECGLLSIELLANMQVHRTSAINICSKNMLCSPFFVLFQPISCTEI